MVNVGPQFSQYLRTTCES